MAETSQNGISADLELAGAESQPAERDGSEYLRLLGDSVRAARARRGMTRKMLAKDSGVSERFLAQLESGTGNASILVLRQISAALNLPLDAMLPGADPQAQELEAALELLRGLDPANLTKAHELLRVEFSPLASRRNERIALIGLRGAGKSTIGKLLGENLGLAFFELDRLIEHESGLSLSMIFDMYGQSGFRRFERRCLEDLLKRENRFVLATGGSLVSEPATYDRMLATCYTIWLKATPQEHMSRVIEQGDMRPMAQNPEAMSDLERILAERNLLYGKADATISTSNQTVQQVLERCVESVRGVIDSLVTGSLRQ
jgi:XRE family transcriptional regulator, aerobic/anaerobic benzoate catabolism transcriptional regulator